MKRLFRGPIVALVACLLCCTALAVPALAVDEQLVIDSATFDDDGIVETRGDVVYFWQSDAQTLDVELSTPGTDGTGRYEFCVEARQRSNGSARTLTCRTEEVEGNDTASIEFAFEHWPDDLTGRQTVTVVVRPGTLNDEVVANATIEAHVIAKGADDDGDGLTNRFEVEAGTNFSDPDTDADGLRDDREVRTYETDPTVADTDDDGLIDGVEVHDHGTDPTDSDTDGDGLNDRAEVTEYGTNPHKPDTDGDGLDDALEVNTYDTDPTSADTDGDGLDDHTEVHDYDTNPTDRDTDGDGLSDPLEVNTYGTNPNAVDTDGDGLEDGPEVNEYDTDPTDADTDGDGLQDGAEVNIHNTNPNDRDTDGDGLQDGAEVGRFETNPNDPDTDGDGRDDLQEARGGLPFVPPPPGDVMFAAVGAALFVGGVIAARRRTPPAIDALRDVTPLSGGRTGTRSEDAPDDSPSGVDDETSDAETATAPEPWPPLSNEDRVLEVLSEHDGRMRQAAIVDETGWSKSKVSRVLSKMADGDQILKIDVGRGNIIALPGNEPERAKSPFEDD